MKQKPLKKLLLLGACVLALGAAPARAQTSGPAVAVVQLTYTVTSFSGASVDIVVSRGAGPAEKMSVKLSPKDSTIEPNALQHVLAKLYGEGYRLKGATGGGNRPSVYVLAKGSE